MPGREVSEPEFRALAFRARALSDEWLLDLCPQIEYVEALPLEGKGISVLLSTEVPLVINVRQVGSATVLDLDGVLKLGGPVDTLRGRVQELLGAGTKNLAFNLSGVPDVDSSGIGALLHAYTMTKDAGGKCKFFSATKRVMQVLKMVRLDKVFDLAEDEASSLAGF